MELRVGSHFQVEGVAAVLADEGYQFVGVAQLAGGAHARGQVSPQGDDAVDAAFPIDIQQLGNALPGTPYAGQVGRGGDALAVQVQHRFNGTVPG